MSDKSQQIKLRAMVELKRIYRKPFTCFGNPFVVNKKDAPVIIHCCYHKIGTVWFGRIFRDIAAEFGLSFGVGSNYQQISGFELDGKPDVFLDLGSHVKLDRLANYTGSHMIRDPRDMVVSGYFYHKWTDEPFPNLPLAKLGGMSYKEYLNSVDQDEGLLAEIKKDWFWIPHMVDWDYNNPRIFEIRYEDMIVDEQAVFRQMFTHYGLTEKAVDRCCQITERYSFGRLTKGKKKRAKSHLRSGKSGEWQDYFNEEHKALFKEMYPNVVVNLGYAEDDDW